MKRLFQPKVIERRPGSIRFKVFPIARMAPKRLPDFDDWRMFARNHEGIEHIEYNPGMISEETILAAVRGISNLLIASIPRYMAAPVGVRESLPGRIRKHFRADPVDITDDQPLRSRYDQESHD